MLNLLRSLEPPIRSWRRDGTQIRYCGRVGCMVLRPYARQGYVSKALHSHLSLVKFWETSASRR